MQAQLQNMKSKIIIAVLFCMNGILCRSQDTTAIPAAPADKAIVYFARTSFLFMAINFSYFDSATLIGTSFGKNYIRYECLPGNHIFWAFSENRDFVEAELEAGRIYFIEVIPQLGAFARVKLQPINPADEKSSKRVADLIIKKEAKTFTPEKLAAETETLQHRIERGLERYRKIKEKGKEISKLEKTWYYK